MVTLLNNLPPLVSILSILGLILLDIIILHQLGQPFISKSGEVKLWHGEPKSPENSEHLVDWYSFGHLISGFLLFYILSYLFPAATLLTLLAITAFIKLVWESFENTDYIIRHFRNNTLSLAYRGDSIINSVSDIVFGLIGLSLASTLPVWIIILLIILFEISMLYFVRDNLTLSIIMFLWPIEKIKNWQVSNQQK